MLAEAHDPVVSHCGTRAQPALLPSAHLMINPPLTLRVAFELVSDLEPSEQEAWLAQHVADAAMREQLHSMLEVDQQPGVLDQPAAELVTRIDEAADQIDGLVGSSIGPYRLDALIGEGGSSVVFRAHRAIGDARQVVALKLLRTGLFSADAQRRFRREQGLLARLTHPNLARLIDGGVSEAGIPYIAMELVDGLPITQHADTRALRLRERLKLFLGVCRAVDAAHRALIVHRDLKPSNVLVTHEGEAKVLDFGIAKLVAGDTEDLTQTHSAAMSPAYAAPEQFRAEPLTTATDVFALGVLLGEMLTGQRVSDPLAGAASTRLRGAARSPPGLPAPATLARILRVDLDAILGKAMAADPDDRYRSAGALGDDIERFLDNEPVAARKPSALYRTAKFVRRHRVATSMFLGASLVVTLALVVAVWEAAQAREHLRRANVTRDFLVELFDAGKSGSPRDQRPTPEVLIQRASERLHARTDLAPDSRFELLRTLGEVSVANGDYPQAERLYGEAAALGHELFVANAHELVDVQLLRATLLLRQNRYQDASVAYEAVLPQIRQADTQAKAEALLNYPITLMFSARVDDALAVAPEFGRLAAAYYTKDPGKMLAASALPATMLVDIGRFKEAIPLLEQVRARWREAAAPPSAQLLSLMRRLGNAHEAVGDLATAAERRAENLATARRIFDPPHDQIAVELLAQGRTAILREHFAQAERDLTDALAMFESVYGLGHMRAANTREALGFLALRQHRYAAAETQLRQALEWCAKPDLHPTRTCAGLQLTLAEALLGQDRVDAAAVANDAAMAIYQKLFPGNHPQVAEALATRGAIQARRGDIDGALATLATALKMLASFGLESSDIAVSARFTRVQALASAGRPADALTELDGVLALHQRSLPDGRVRRVEMLTMKAELLARLGQPPSPGGE